MFFIKSGRSMNDLLVILPGVVAISILFGTTSMLAVAVTFEKKNRSFERLIRPTLEDVFVRITGIEANAMKREKEKKGGGL